ncbi:galactose-1-phosphate uridylyltransferase [Trueperella bernardiae]|uniref:galactose-1-phosphate uridylyltransferase n=1 Tax=Trueperella bernardiae TaxID=59561 RepID=UPI000C7C7B29|nr:galactose-1-phosphate uridylyltransferase [Trueperella bernardiae]MDV6239433.1 galactose-1-phosphate uridylyltransferase [Trueperella bernardiae]PKZ88569.1 galactose-1-phosphate uridylyltransferase [Trueperella bernardiae]
MTLRRVYEAIDALVDYARAHLELGAANEDWARNQIFGMFGLNSYEPTGARGAEHVRPDALLAEFAGALAAEGLIEDYQADAVCDQAMGYLTLIPSQLQERFAQVRDAEGGDAAMAWLYEYSIRSNYVRRAVLDRNPRFETRGLIVTINKAKPEFKDPKKAAAGNAVAGGYPRCSICHENEGFAGRAKFTLRTVPLKMGTEDWFWQFSPYGYLDEHGIAVNTLHTPMHVDADAFRQLISFVDQYPSLFIGCNAALPRIGGSVLGHDHYQGGGELLPMHTAKTWKEVQDPDHPDAGVEILDWHNTAIRVVSPDAETVVAVCEKIHDAWVSYSNPELGIIARDDEGVHSATSPTVIRTERGYEMSLILRSNVTTEEFPAGVFHAHPEFHAVKQESIGLIEAQGLFILPGRLDSELALIADAIESGADLPADLEPFRLLFDETKEALSGSTDRAAIDAAIRDELGSICERILDNTAVFKHKEQTLAWLLDHGFEAR